VNAGLLDAFRHHAWANDVLIGFVRAASLSDAQLTTAHRGAFGSIVGTLAHVLEADGNYVATLRAVPRPTAPEQNLDALTVRARENAAAWEAFIAQDDDPERVIVVDDGENEVHAGVITAQALHHGTLHREQVCAMLTELGIEPPDLQAWEYAWETKRLLAR
jgi:uncharacterized damage-inducible protein DinB